jgi:hypothetical protein
VKPETKIDIEKLESEVLSLKEKMTVHQLERSLKAISYLKHGAPSFQTEKLPGCFVKNAASCYVHGRQVTENIATWIKEGYAAGPFDGPPCANFRVNPLIAVVQPGKVRPVMNVSSPNGESYNSNVDEHCTETVKMASAKKFSQKILDCGPHAVMSKHDLIAAYKQVPCRIEDLRLQGFYWLGKYFVETRQVFGAKTSVCNYDILGETLKLLAVLKSTTPDSFVLRQVDDVPSVGPAGSGFCEDFTNSYKGLCETLNVKLAENCPLNDKAFETQIRGKVLGVMFDTSDLTWRLSDKKLWKAKCSVKKALTEKTISLRDCQRLIGRMNDISIMCPLMKSFKKPVIDMLAGIPSDAHKDLLLTVTKEAKNDLWVWAGFLESDFKWLPIPRELDSPPLRCKEFVSDAAGMADTADPSAGPGCGNIAFCEFGTVIYANRFQWPYNFIQAATDEKGVRYGDKTTTLEMIGLLMPFLTVPELLKNQHIVFKVDCFGTIYGMMNKAAKGDSTASVFIRAAHLIAAYLECTMHIQHLPRVSDWGAEVTDRLSRSSTMTSQDRKLVRAFRNRKVPGCLLEWFENPKCDWNLAVKLLEHVKKLV